MFILYDVIREARADDADALAILAGQLGYPSSGEQIRVRLSRINGAVMVEEVEGQVVGWICVGVVCTLESDPYAHVFGLVVDESHRGQGIGERLIRAAVDWSRGEGFARLRLRANVVRKDAHRFYERIGFERLKEQRVYELSLLD